MRRSNPKPLACWVCLLGVWFSALATLAQQEKPGPQDCLLLTVSGTVQVLRVGASAWSAGQTNQVLPPGCRIRTGKNSRASLRLSNLTVLRIFELTTLELSAPEAASKGSALNVQSGMAYFFNRDRPGEVEFRTPAASGAIRGTEFNVLVREDGHTELALLDGQVTLTNGQGAVELNRGEIGTVDKGRAPRKSAILNAVNVIQWTLYYPAILDPADLRLTAESKSALMDSLAAYRSGDLLRALAEYPADRVAQDDAEKVYHAALLLSVGKVEGAEALLGPAQGEPAAAALRELISTVKGERFLLRAPRTLTTEWMAGSYAAQSGHNLADALEMARKAAEKSPGFGFARERVAELEFGFGRVTVGGGGVGRVVASVAAQRPGPCLARICARGTESDIGSGGRIRRRNRP